MQLKDQEEAKKKASAKYIQFVELLGIINFLYEISNLFMISSHRD